MRTLLLLNKLLLIFTLLLGSGMTTVSAKPLAEPVLAEAAPEDRELIVTLRSATGATITPRKLLSMSCFWAILKSVSAPNPIRCGIYPPPATAQSSSSESSPVWTDR